MDDLYQPGVARFQRPTRRDALDLARELFVRGERVDMHTLSSTLGIGRTTLYRWVGDREQLVGEVLAGLTDVAWEMCFAQARGTGPERALDIGRRFMELTASYRPLREFAAREPQLALRVLLAADGVVAGRIRAGFRRALDENMPDADIDPELIDIAVQAGTVLEWTPVTIGGEPEIERASRLIRSLFETDAATRVGSRPRPGGPGHASFAFGTGRVPGRGWRGLLFPV